VGFGGGGGRLKAGGWGVYAQREPYCHYY